MRRVVSTLSQVADTACCMAHRKSKSSLWLTADSANPRSSAATARCRWDSHGVCHMNLTSPSSAGVNAARSSEIGNSTSNVSKSAC